MEFSINRGTLINKIMAIILATISIIANFYFSNDKLIYLCCLATCFIILLRSFKHKYLFLINFFISSYVLLLYPYFIRNLGIGTFSTFNTTSYYQRTIFLFSVFLTSLLFFYKDLPVKPLTKRLSIDDNRIVYYLNILIIICILFFGASGQTVITANYGSNQAAATTVFVYMPIFYISAYISSGRNKVRLAILNILVLIYSVTSLLYGWRGGILTMGLLIYIVVIDRYISFPILMLFIILGFLFLSFWGQFRLGASITDFSFSEIISLSSSYNDKYSVRGNNQTDVFYASVRIITLTDLGLINLYDRIIALFLFIASIFVPFSILPPLANLSNYMSSDYSTLGGGMIFSYFYVYLSYFGIILIAYFINFIWNKLRASSSRYMLVYSFLVFCTVGTWFAYGPITMFKLCLLGTIYVFGVDAISKLIVGKK